MKAKAKIIITTILAVSLIALVAVAGSYGNKTISTSSNSSQSSTDQTNSNDSVLTYSRFLSELKSKGYQIISNPTGNNGKAGDLTSAAGGNYLAFYQAYVLIDGVQLQVSYQAEPSQIHWTIEEDPPINQTNLSVTNRTNTSTGGHTYTQLPTATAVHDGNGSQSTSSARDSQNTQNASAHSYTVPSDDASLLTKLMKQDGFNFVYYNMEPTVSSLPSTVSSIDGSPSSTTTEAGVLMPMGAVGIQILPDGKVRNWGYSLVFGGSSSFGDRLFALADQLGLITPEQATQDFYNYPLKTADLVSVLSNPSIIAYIQNNLN